MDWAAHNWFLIFVIGYGLASELIGMSSLKQNTVVEVIMFAISKGLRIITGQDK